MVRALALVTVALATASCGSEGKDHFEIWRNGQAVEFDQVSCTVSQLDQLVSLDFAGVNTGSEVTDSYFSYGFSLGLDPNFVEPSSYEINGQLISTVDGPQFVAQDGHHAAVKSALLEYHWLTVVPEYRSNMQGALHITELSDGSLIGNLDIETRGSIPGDGAVSVYRVDASLVLPDRPRP